MTTPPTNEEIAALYRETAALMDLTGSPPEAVRRRARTAGLIEALTRPAHVLLAEGRLGDVRGIGGRTVAEVRAIVRRGRFEPLEQLRRLVPPTLLRLLELPGLDVARLRILWLALGVVSVADLELACRRNRVRDLPDLGPELQARLERALRRGQGWGRRRFLDVARATASNLLRGLQRDPHAIRLAVTGGLRRMDTLVDEVGLLATAHDADALLDAFVALPAVSDVLERGPRHARVMTGTGIEARLEVAEGEEDFPRRLLEATGSETDPAPAATPPVEMADVRGVGWLHTDAGAGSAPVETMLEAPAGDGYAWALVADRSPSAFPRGASEEDFRRTRARLAEATPEGLEVFHGVLADVLPDGRIDASEALLDLADVVVGQVNDGFAADGGPQDADGMTRRLLRAVESGRLHALELPPGGCVGGAPPWEADLEAVLDACARHGVALAWSGLPHRHLLPDALHARAQALGLLALPAADAHAPEGVDQALLAVAWARRHGWTREQVLTTRDAAGFRAFLDAGRGG